MPKHPFTPEHQRYVRRIWAATLIYVSPLMLRIVLPNAIVARAWVHIPLLILPMIGMIGFFYAMHRLVVETDDEYQRHILVKVYQLSTWLVLSIAAVIGFLQDGQYVRLVPLFAIPILWFLCFGFSSVWVRWREGRQDHVK